MAYTLAKNGKPFAGGEILKNCLLEIVDGLCPEKSNVIKTITLGANTVALRIRDMSTNLMEQIASHAKNFVHFSLEMDESTDMCGTSQLRIFIRGVDANLNITQELVSLNSMYNTTTEEDLMREIQKTFEQYSLDWNGLKCLTIDGGRNMCGVKKGLVEKIKQF